MPITTVQINRIRQKIEVAIQQKQPITVSVGGSARLSAHEANKLSEFQTWFDTLDLENIVQVSTDAGNLFQKGSDGRGFVPKQQWNTSDW